MAKKNSRWAVNLTALVLAVGLLMGLFTGCPNGSGPNRPNESAQPNGQVQPTDPSIFKTGGNGVITGYKCAQEALPANLVIPAKIGDEEIKEISLWAFAGCTGLTSIILPANLTEIGGGAFEDCTGLTSVHLPANLTKIGWLAFFGCTGLTSITLPANLTEIGGGAFSGCTGLISLTIDSANTKYKTEGNILYSKDGTTLILAAGGLTSVNIPGTVTTIYWKAFSGCRGLTSISLPANLTEIGGGAFEDCTGLTSISLPANLTEIGWCAFSRCTGLTSAVFVDKEGWKVYDNDSYSGTSTTIEPSDLADVSKAAKYLRGWSFNGGYCDKYWKKN
ncbi:leucine-rich repeat domain-containing protein [Treponema denticola]|uniref:leucine-rich repeat domain-containing protein n=1 Tax=Treponema denticola TaxID=158 RepID=UPI0020A4D94F|nr:leucine-rich repeat domain-containing protein [Treponema denticola]UTC94694.1 leucine-rich repeat domain-containing protein [Treponema denticola]